MSTMRPRTFTTDRGTALVQRDEQTYCVKAVTPRGEDHPVYADVALISDGRSYGGDRWEAVVNGRTFSTHPTLTSAVHSVISEAFSQQALRDVIAQQQVESTRQERIEAHPLYSALSLIDPLLAGLRPMRDGDRVVFVPQPREARLDVESCLRELRARVERILLDVA